MLLLFLHPHHHPPGLLGLSFISRAHVLRFIGLIQWIGALRITLVGDKDGCNVVAVLGVCHDRKQTDRGQNDKFVQHYRNR